VNILEEIGQLRGCDSCIILTYNIDLAWFESLVYQRLITAGVRRILIIADLYELASTIERQGGSIHRAGIDYSTIGINASGCFHPKAVFLSGQNIAQLYVGSGNLSTGGFGRNLEVFERIEVRDEDREIPAAFGQFREYLEKLFQSYLDVVSTSIENLMTHAFGVDILTLPQLRGSQVQLLGSPAGLFPRLNIPNEPSESLTLLAPYFDPKGEMVLELAKRFNSTDFRVITDKRRTNLCAEAAELIKTAGGTIQFLDVDNERPLHAKIIFGKGRGWSLGLFGSANLSKAAWFGHNAELVALRHNELSNEIESLLDSLNVKDACETELQELGQFRPGEDHPKEHEFSIDSNVTKAKWIGKNQIELNFNCSVSDSAITIEFFTQNTSGISQGLTRGEKDTILIASAPQFVSRGRPVFGRICQNDAVGPWFVVEDPRRLAEHAKAGRRVDEYARDLLFGDDHTNTTEKLLKFLTKVYQKRKERLNSPTEDTTSDKIDKAGKESKQIEWAWVREDDFRTLEDFSSKDLSFYQATGGRLRLINLLLFGSESPTNADDDEGESDLDEHSGEINIPVRNRKVPQTQKIRKQVRLTEITAKARKSYLEQLHPEDIEGQQVYPLGRLAEDMLVLSAAIHSAFESGYLSQMDYRTEIKTVLMAFLGNSNAPFVKALSIAEEKDSAEDWEEIPLFLFICLILYNLSLAHADGGKIQTEEVTLWFRHLLPFVPKEHVSYVINDLDRQLPMLKNGVFWIQNAFAAQIASNPIKDFIKDLVRMTYSILDFEKVLPKIENSVVSESDLYEDDKVVYQSLDGHLKVGFAEETEQQGNCQVWLRENPFDPMPESGDRNFERPRGSIASVFPFKRLLAYVKDVNDLKANEAVLTLRKIADS
jgi:HKD family nuclease